MVITRNIKGVLWYATEKVFCLDFAGLYVGERRERTKPKPVSTA
jgi:hypothetical protein